MVRGGKPCGSVPTSFTPCASSWKIRAATIESTTAARIPGSFGRKRPSTTINAIPNNPIASAAVTVSPFLTPLKKPLVSAMKPSASIENPNSFGS